MSQPILMATTLGKHCFSQSLLLASFHVSIAYPALNWGDSQTDVPFSVVMEMTLLSGEQG